VILVDVSDDGFDGSTTAHLAANGLGDTPDLAADPDLEAVRIVVAAIALVSVDTAGRNACELFEIGDDGAKRMAIVRVAVQRLGMQHELPALGGGSRRRDRDLAAELVGFAGLPFADAFDLGRVQRIDLRPALALLLMAHTQRQIEQWAKAIFECCIARNLTTDVTDDAAKPGAQELELAPGALELVGMAVAPHHDSGPLGNAPIALAQLDAPAFGQIDQLFDRA